MTLSKRSVVVLTGAGSGIGRALAIEFAKEGIEGLAIADIDVAGLAETASMISGPTKLSTHIVNVGDRKAMELFAAEVLRDHSKVTHLVNNAGVGLIGTFEQISIEDFDWLMNINFWGVVFGTKLFLPILKQQAEETHIVNISSVFGLIAPPEQTAYCSSKFAVRGFTEALRHELEGTRVSVSTVHPGGIRTNIARNSRLGENTPEEYKTQGVKFFDRVAETTPENAAQTIVAGIRTKNPRILIGRDAFLISYIHRLFPKRYLRVIERLSGHRLSLRN